MTLRFRSDGSVTYRGFISQFQAIYGKPPFPSPSQYPTTYPLYTTPRQGNTIWRETEFKHCNDLTI